MSSILTLAQLNTGEEDGMLETVFLNTLLREHLSDREHLILAMRVSGYTRPNVVDLLGIGKTTAYTCERRATEKLRRLLLHEEGM